MSLSEPVAKQDLGPCSQPHSGPPLPGITPPPICMAMGPLHTPTHQFDLISSQGWSLQGEPWQHLFPAGCTGHWRKARIWSNKELAF